MKKFVCTTKRYSHAHSRSILLGFTLVALTVLLGGCDTPGDVIEQMIDQIGKTRQAIINESEGWRNELPKLENFLTGMESQATGDVKGVVADVANQASELSRETINLSEAAAKDVIASAGAEARCDFEFVKKGTLDQLQYMIDDLKFWKGNKQHLDKKPTHFVCAILPSALSLYQSGNDWKVDPNKNPTSSLVHVYGYNFRGDALPRLQLQNANGTPISDVNLTPAYVTRYQIDLNFVTANFTDLQPGPRVVFRWPDLEDPNTISLLLTSPAQLKISNPVYSPTSAVARETAVALKVTITNQGGSASGTFVAYWKPDSQDSQIYSITIDQLNPSASKDITFPGYVYKRGGTVEGSVYLNNGNDRLPTSLKVSPPNPFLQKAMVRFNSHDDGKDDDTSLDIQIVRTNGVILATGRGPVTVQGPVKGSRIRHFHAGVPDASECPFARRAARNDSVTEDLSVCGSPAPPSAMPRHSIQGASVELS